MNRSPGRMWRSPRSWGWALSVFVLAACPAAHDPYSTSRECVENPDCTRNEWCAYRDAGADGGYPRGMCHDRTGLTVCDFPDAGELYYCFGPGMICRHTPRQCLKYDGGCPTGGCADPDSGAAWDAACMEHQDESFGCGLPDGGR